MTKKQIKNLSLVLIFGFVMSLSLFAPKQTQAAIADHLVINEIHIDGVAGAGGTEDDWIELFNPTASDVSLDGWSIQRMTASGATIAREPLSGVVLAGGYLLLVRDGITTNQALKDQADILLDADYSLSSDNTVFLVSDNVNITDTLDENIVDYVGYGLALNFEGSLSAPNITETRSLSRVPDGEDTDENSVDLVLLDVPTPQNSGETSENATAGDLQGSVALTITPDTNVVQNLTYESVEIVFQVNADANVQVAYGFSDSYGSVIEPSASSANTEIRIGLSELECSTVYHYSIQAETLDASDSDQTFDATFETLPCGVSLDSLNMTKTSSRANNDYIDGWEWEFAITAWNATETSLKMKFNEWTGASALSAGGNMRYSVNGVDWVEITGNDLYPDAGIDISAIDEDTVVDGRQVLITVQMKVPVGTLVGDYSSGYGILVE